jgi:putative SOS response-associated peptidase YedK
MIHVRSLHLQVTWEEIVRLYRLTLDVPARNVQPRYNICPTTPVDVVLSSDGKRSVVPMRWGLVPIWRKKSLKEATATFNARVETVATKPMFATTATGRSVAHRTPRGDRLTLGTAA